MSVLGFTWKGISTDDMGVHVKRLPAIVSPGRREEKYTVPGRNGVLHVPGNAREELVLLADIYLPYEQGTNVASMDDVRAWLTGSGWFTQSDIPGRAFHARITDAISFAPVVDGFADRLASVTLYADPYQYQYPAAVDIIFTAAGSMTNPGNAMARPILTVSGTGDVTVMIGQYTVMIDGMTEDVTLDCDARMAWNESEDIVSVTLGQDDWPEVPPGQVNVSFTGAVTRVTVTPRWRYE